MPILRPIIGLTGQVCAGKSTVAQAFQSLGASLYQADQEIHRLYTREDVKQELRARFGEAPFDAQGAVDRKRLGDMVFRDPRQLEFLTQRILFPRTAEVLVGRIADFRAGKDRAPALLVDAPTLFEAGRADWCDRILFVQAPRPLRQRWAAQGRGWDEAELVRRERQLQDEAAKKARCDALLENDGSRAELEAQVLRLWQAWVGLPAQGPTEDSR